MRAWTVDADDIRVVEGFDDALLHRTPEIDTFPNVDRDDKFIVIGTKRVGKTLLLPPLREGCVARKGCWFALCADQQAEKKVGDVRYAEFPRRNGSSPEDKR